MASWENDTRYMPRFQRTYTVPWLSTTQCPIKVLKPNSGPSVYKKYSEQLIWPATGQLQRAHRGSARPVARGRVGSFACSRQPRHLCTDFLLEQLAGV